MRDSSILLWKISLKDILKIFFSVDSIRFFELIIPFRISLKVFGISFEDSSRSE